MGQVGTWRTGQAHSIFTTPSLFLQDISGSSCTSTQTAHTVPLGKEVSQETLGKQQYPGITEEQHFDQVRLELAWILGSLGKLRQSEGAEF